MVGIKKNYFFYRNKIKNIVYETVIKKVSKVVEYSFLYNFVIKFFEKKLSSVQNISGSATGWK